MNFGTQGKLDIQYMVVPPSIVTDFDGGIAIEGEGRVKYVTLYSCEGVSKLGAEILANKFLELNAALRGENKFLRITWRAYPELL